MPKHQACATVLIILESLNAVRDHGVYMYVVYI